MKRIWPGNFTFLACNALSLRKGNRGRKIFEPPRYMTSKLAIEQILQVLPAEEHELRPDRTLAISIARLGWPDQKFIGGTLAELVKIPDREWGAPLFSLVIVGKRINPVERDFTGRWALNPSGWKTVCTEVYGCKD